jgi:hypothetical protein
MHFDLRAQDSVEFEVARLVALGATVLRPGPDLTVMGDPEGNEFLRRVKTRMSTVVGWVDSATCVFAWLAGVRRVKMRGCDCWFWAAPPFCRERSLDRPRLADTG